jgi:hypothetical protein
MSEIPPAFVNIDVLAALEHCRKADHVDQKVFDIENLFTKARALGWKGDYQRAWELLVDANRKADTEDASVHQLRRRGQEASLRLAEVFVPPPGGGEPKKKRVPVSLFILGPSRSGKTTIELLTSSIGDVKRGYENLLVDNAVGRATQSAGFPTVRSPVLMPAAVEPAFTEAYLTELGKRASGAKVFTNTHPAIIDDVGRLSCLVPNARFVFVKRNVDDVGIRIFMKKYHAGNHYAYDLGNIHAQVAWYYRMADIWTEKLPGISLILNYEDVIADPQAARAQIARFIGLPVPRGSLPRLGDDRGCAEPYKSFMDAELSR